MDKNAIKKYAIWARRELIARVSQRAAMYEITAEGYGDADAVSVHGRILTLEEKNQRKALIAKIKEKGYEQVMEEVAYTWFNRFSALRFMEVNGYLPSHVRVFTDDENNFKPQIMTEAVNLEMDGLDMQKVFAFKTANDDDSLFKYLVITQCNALSAILPGMFQQISDYTELLFPDNLLREGSVAEQMISMIPEEDWTDQVQIIGWLYQYYNTEQSELVYDGTFSKSKVPKELLPAATTIYTPDWPVHYMVENSLGRLWLEGHPNEVLKAEWKYYINETEQKDELQEKLYNIRKMYLALKPEDIRVFDPCMGSGHILCVLFDLLIRIYEDCGYTTPEAVVNIVGQNLWGIDIDDRAAQLSYFAVMMKACQYDRRFLLKRIRPHLYAIRETNILGEAYKKIIIDKSLLSEEYQKILNYLLDTFIDAKEYGSILKLENYDYLTLKKVLQTIANHTAKDLNLTLWYASVEEELQHLVDQAIALTQKYHIVVTNPPYFGSTRFSPKLDAYIKQFYPEEKADLSMVMYRQVIDNFIKENGYVAFITTSSWLFLSSFEKLRKYIYKNTTISTIVDFGTELFEGKVGHNPIVSWITQKNSINYKFVAIRLVDYCYSRRDEKEKQYFNSKNYYYSCQEDFTKIPGAPVVYWISEKLLNVFEHNITLGTIARPRIGQNTGDNNRFLRFWYEVKSDKITFGLSHDEITTAKYKWIPYNKGGEYRRWYGNQEYVINWENDGDEVKRFAVIRNRGKHWSRYIQNIDNLCKPGVTWSFVTSGPFSVRYLPAGFICDVAGSAIFPEKKDILELTALCNSKIALTLLKLLNPTINMQAGNVANIPVHSLVINNKEIEDLAISCISLSREDWNSFEKSWEFKEHPIISSTHLLAKKVEPVTIKRAFDTWKDLAEKRFFKIKENEEGLNRLLINIYNLKDELDSEVEDKDITVRKADIQRDIRSYISYSVGCMFGRYSLDQPGLILAGQDFKEKFVYSNVPLLGTGFSGMPSLVSGKRVCYLKRGDNDFVRCTFEPDEDAIIPICDDEYFNDDIVSRFVEFVEVVYGKETLEENLQFIADALGGSGTSREVIRNYFINGFYSDHLKIYQKRPIYWLFDSGKKNGFKCLVYMHRYQPDTIARIRTDYVHEQQSRYRTAIADLQSRIDNATSTSERVKLSKKLKTVQEQDEELRIYEEKIHHLADQMIKIDLDDGVKVNYAKFQDVLAKIK